MYFPIFINWTSQFPILGLLGVVCFFFFFSFLFKYCIETSVCKNGEPDQTPRFAAFDLVLQCLPMSRQKDARLILVN